jgi:peroxiredoxin
MFRRLSFLSLGILAGCAAANVHHSSPRHESSLPAIDLLTLDGQPVQLTQAIGGRPALVSLWATWCEACTSEFESLSRLSERAPSLGAVVVAVAVGEPRAKVAEFVKSHNLNYVQLVDEQFHFSDEMSQKRVPATLVVDRSGSVTYSGGLLDESALSALERAITQPGRASAAR